MRGGRMFRMSLAALFWGKHNDPVARLQLHSEPAPSSQPLTTD